MFKTIAFVLAAALITGCGSSGQVTGTSVAAVADHKTVAVLPFEVILASKTGKLNKYSDAEIEELKIYSSLTLQRFLHETLKTKQKRFPFSATIQDGEITNSILSANKISFAALFSGDKTALCKLLGVDAVIMPQMIFGIKDPASISATSAYGDIAMQAVIYDVNTAAPVWKYNRQLNYNSVVFKMNKTDEAAAKEQELVVRWNQLVEKLFDNFAAEIPYKKTNNLK